MAGHLQGENTKKNKKDTAQSFALKGFAKFGNLFGWFSLFHLDNTLVLSAAKKSKTISKIFAEFAKYLFIGS